MILFRTVVLSLLILALANVQLVRSSHRLTVLFLLDQSASIPAVARDAMVPFVTRQVAEHRDSTRSDRAGVIVFANEAQMEVPPIDDDLPLIDRFEGVDQLPTDATDLSAALRLAMATFPEDTARRVVIITDGNETIGSAAETAARLATAGVGIDVVPVQLPPADDVAVERIVLPADDPPRATVRSPIGVAAECPRGRRGRANNGAVETDSTAERHGSDDRRGGRRGAAGQNRLDFSRRTGSA